MVKVSDRCYIAPGAVIAGDVVIGERSSVWYNAVIRGDLAPIFIGNHTNIQDNAVIHVTPDIPVRIGDNVTVGHGAIVHSATVEDNVLIGMGAIVLNGAVIRKNSIVGAGALIPPGKEVPSYSVAVGVPAELRTRDKSIVKYISDNAEEYVELAHRYLSNDVDVLKK